MMLTLDEAENIIRKAFAPLECRMQRGPYQESLSVLVCDANGNPVDDLGTMTSLIFGHKAALDSILLSARVRICNNGYSLAPWSEN